MILTNVETSRLTPPYRKKPNRLTGHDYRQPGAYFVTLCRQDPRLSFGDVVAGEMVPNAVGHMILAEWQALADAILAIELDSVMLMPDHLHGIIMLGTDPDVPVWPSLGEIVARFKNASNRCYFAHVRDGTWPPIDQRLWQLRYYDRIIRNDRELDRIRTYIATNPARWEAKRRGES